MRPAKIDAMIPAIKPAVTDRKVDHFLSTASSAGVLVKNYSEDSFFIMSPIPNAIKTAP